MNNIEKIRRRGALVVAAIKGEEALAKCAASIDEIAEAKREAAKYIASARSGLGAHVGDDLEKIARDIHRIEINDKNYRPGRIAKRATEADLGAAAIDATLRHRRGDRY